METPTRMKPTRTQIKEGSPEIFLKEENLVYYRNIEDLKEVTRQANALLDRSNTKYENILDDQKLGYKVRAKSNSDSTKSLSPETEGKCRKCGLSHGAANFCIVEQIMDDERQMEDNKRRSKFSGKGSWRSAISMEPTNVEPQSTLDETSTKEDQRKHIWGNINILEQMTTSQVLDRYDMLCAQYGASAARQFLLANSIANPPERKIERWATPSEDQPERIGKLSKKPLTHYNDIIKSCHEANIEGFQPFCNDISEEVTKKMEQLVHLIPPCEGQPLANIKKKWRAVFSKHPTKQEAASLMEIRRSEKAHSEDSVTDKSCSCKIDQCVCGTEKICTTPKIEKKFSMNQHEDDYENNYVLTMRKQIWKRRETKRAETLNALFSKQTMSDVVKNKRESEEYIRKAKVEQYKSLKNCLTQHLKDERYDRHEFEKNVQKLTDMFSPNTAINIRQWDHWLQRMKEQQEIEEQDEIDSLPSEIQTDEESKTTISHSTGVDYKPVRCNPTRIPYADDVYDLIDNLYDKISHKFEKDILKNSFKTSRLSYRPTFAFLHRRMTLLSYQNPLFHEIMNLAKIPSYAKRLTPYRVRKSRKMKRLKALQRKQVRTERRRVMARGLQLGKQYRKICQAHKYAPESGYIGFKPQERKLLDPNEPNRFAKFSSVKEPLGQAITTKRIHHDFRLMCSLFDDASKASREDLMDQGMLDRLHQFQKKLYNVNIPQPPLADSDTEYEGLSDFTYRIPHKDEDVQLLRKANSQLESVHGNLRKQVSYENVPHKEDIRPTKPRGAEQSNSTDKLKNMKKFNCTTAQLKIVNNYGTPQKCTSSTNVKGEKTKRKEKSQQRESEKVDTHVTQNLQIRSSVKSLTNLLPPLKGHNAKNMADNEFEETISSLQRELSNLLTQKSCGRSTVAPIKTGEPNETKSIPKKRNSGLIKLPELKTTSRKISSKSSMSKISNESLPHIKQRESVENLKPGRLQEKLPKKGLGRKMSMLNIQSGNSKSLTNGKLPQLVENRTLRYNPSNESLSKGRKKSGSKKSKIKVPTILKQSVTNKAWR